MGSGLGVWARELSSKLCPQYKSPGGQGGSDEFRSHRAPECLVSVPFLKGSRRGSTALSWEGLASVLKEGRWGQLQPSPGVLLVAELSRLVGLKSSLGLAIRLDTYRATSETVLSLRKTCGGGEAPLLEPMPGQGLAYSWRWSSSVASPSSTGAQVHCSAAPAAEPADWLTVPRNGRNHPPFLLPRVAK